MAKPSPFTHCVVTQLTRRWFDERASEETITSSAAAWDDYRGWLESQRDRAADPVTLRLIAAGLTKTAFLAELRLSELSAPTKARA